MCLDQMADRCPSSIFKGRGRLMGYRWQINERGVANIVTSRNDCVEGLVYDIDKSSRRQLDKSEGVSRGYYDTEHVPIELTPLSYSGYKTGYVAKSLKSRLKSRQEVDRQPYTSESCVQGHGRQSSRQAKTSTNITLQHTGTWFQDPVSEDLSPLSKTLPGITCKGHMCCISTDRKS